MKTRILSIFLLLALLFLVGCQGKEKKPDTDTTTGTQPSDVPTDTSRTPDSTSSSIDDITCVLPADKSFRFDTYEELFSALSGDTKLYDSTATLEEIIHANEYYASTPFFDSFIEYYNQNQSLPLPYCDGKRMDWNPQEEWSGIEFQAPSNYDLPSITYMDSALCINIQYAAPFMDEDTIGNGSVDDLLYAIYSHPLYTEKIPYAMESYQRHIRNFSNNCTTVELQLEDRTVTAYYRLFGRDRPEYTFAYDNLLIVVWGPWGETLSDTFWSEFSIRSTSSDSDFPPTDCGGTPPSVIFFESYENLHSALISGQGTEAFDDLRTNHYFDGQLLGTFLDWCETQDDLARPYWYGEPLDLEPSSTSSPIHFRVSGLWGLPTIQYYPKVLNRAVDIQISYPAPFMNDLNGVNDNLLDVIQALYNSPTYAETYVTPPNFQELKDKYTAKYTLVDLQLEDRTVQAFQGEIGSDTARRSMYLFSYDHLLIQVTGDASVLNNSLWSEFSIRSTSTAADDTSSTPPQEDEPVVFDPQPYVPYMSYSSFKNEAINERIDSLIGSTIQLSPEVFPGTEELKEVESNVPDITWEWGGYSMIGTYLRTETQFGETIQYYRVGDHGELGYNVDTQNWIYINLTTENWIDTNPTGEKLTLEECSTIALEYLQSYVETIGTDINLNEYIYNDDTYLQGVTLKYYPFRYKKQLDHSTEFETLVCCVTEYGSLVHLSRSTDYDSFFENIAGTVNYDMIYANLNKIGTAVCDACSEWDITYQIFDRYNIEKLNDGSYLFKFFILYQYTDQGVEWEQKMNFELIIQ